MADLKSFPTEENAKEAGFSTVVDYMTATPAEHVCEWCAGLIAGNLLLWLKRDGA